jgi:hypothetical protein
MVATVKGRSRARYTARRKAIYEEKHPATKQGGNQDAGGQLAPCRQLGDTVNVVRFTADTARATGKSERAVQRDAERGGKIAADVLRSAASVPSDIWIPRSSPF